MFKHKIVRQLTLLLAVKLVLIFTIKGIYFDKPVLQNQDDAYRDISHHFFNHNVNDEQQKSIGENNGT